MPTHPALPDERPAPPPPPTASRQLPEPVQRLLRLPLFYKILVANAVLVLSAALAGSLATAAYVRRDPGHLLEVAWGIGLGAVVVTVVVNALILRLALRPLHHLENTAARVQAGDLDARVPRSPLADRELDRLSRTFNGMLDSGTAYRARLREVAAAALNAAEEERKRISRELHDETAQLLAALLIRIRLVRGADPADADALLEEMREEVGVALEGVRRFARGLRPPALDELGLVPSIESHARSVRETSGIDVHVDAEPLKRTLPPEAELAVYRIVQEALSNVVRHSGATRADVRLARDGDVLRVCVRDDGRGFSVEGAKRAGGGLGLFGMEERAAYLGGHVVVHSRAGEGTTVTAEVPLGPPPAA
jgi:two-component system, NarL family, sensor histidine kinase UhpB